MSMVAIIEGVEFEVENRAEALSSAPGLGAMDVTVRYWHPLRPDLVGEEHFRLVEGQWWAFRPNFEEWIALEEDGRVIHPKITRTDLPAPGAA